MEHIRKIIIIIVCWLLPPGFINAQVNLVYNGNFEIYSQCPAWGISNNAQIIYADGWFVSGGSPDYWHVCSNGVPGAQVGYQYDCCGGSGYAGMYTIVSINTPGDDLGREYIGTKLLDTLKAGHKYLASMYVNRANFNYSMATIGMLFTDTAVVLPNPQQAALLAASPQIKNTTLLSDTANWVLIQDTLTAIGNESYLTIGNFNSTATSDTMMSSGSWWFYGSAYYYIDHVSVYDLATLDVEQETRRKVDLNISPNPSEGYAWVKYHISEDTELQITDMNGNLIKRYTLFSDRNKLEINNETLANGIYLYRVVTNSIITTGKIVIMK